MASGMTACVASAVNVTARRVSVATMTAVTSVTAVGVTMTNVSEAQAK